MKTPPGVKASQRQVDWLFSCASAGAWLAA